MPKPGSRMRTYAYALRQHAYPALSPDRARRLAHAYREPQWARHEEASWLLSAKSRIRSLVNGTKKPFDTGAQTRLACDPLGAFR